MRVQIEFHKVCLLSNKFSKFKIEKKLRKKAVQRPAKEKSSLDQAFLFKGALKNSNANWTTVNTVLSNFKIKKSFPLNSLKIDRSFLGPSVNYHMHMINRRNSAARLFMLFPRVQRRVHRWALRNDLGLCASMFSLV